MKNRCHRTQQCQGLFFWKSVSSKLAQACALAAKALMEKPDVVGGKVYHIVDGGEPVDSYNFWLPLIEAFGREPPSWRCAFASLFIAKSRARTRK